MFSVRDTYIILLFLSLNLGIIITAVVAFVSISIDFGGELGVGRSDKKKLEGLDFQAPWYTRR